MSMPLFVRAVAPVALSFALIALAPAPAVPAPAAAAPSATEPGDLWEVTSKMSMEGMPMELPAQKSKVCSPRTWTEPPAIKGDEKCETLEFRNTAAKTTWKVRCPGPPAMTGEGTITRTSPEAYTGTMKFTSEEGNMTMALSGRRVGDCDAAAARKETQRQIAQIEDTQKQAEATQAQAMKEACAGAASTMDIKQMRMYGDMCAEKDLKATFCMRLEMVEGFELVCGEDPKSSTSLDEAAAYCGWKPEDVTRKVCDEALEKENLDLLGRCCPAQTQSLAQRECAGRKYSEMAGSKYQSFCVAYARDLLVDAPKEKSPAKKKFKLPWPR